MRRETKLTMLHAASTLVACKRIHFVLTPPEQYCQLTGELRNLTESTDWPHVESKQRTQPRSPQSEIIVFSDAKNTFCSHNSRSSVEDVSQMST